MAAAVGLGRAATMASVRAAGDDVARPLSRQHDLTGRQWKRWTCMQMKTLMLETQKWGKVKNTGPPRASPTELDGSGHTSGHPLHGAATSRAL